MVLTTRGGVVVVTSAHSGTGTPSGLALRGVVLGIAAADLKAQIPPAKYTADLVGVVTGWRSRGQIGDFVFLA